MKQALAPLSAAACVPVAALVTWSLGADVALAAVGAALGLLYSLLELGTLLLASRGSFGRSVAVGVGGMVLRLLIMLAALAAIGLLTTREQTLAAVLGFIAAFTVSFVVRMVVTPALLRQAPAGAGAERPAAGPLLPQRGGRGGRTLGS